MGKDLLTLKAAKDAALNLEIQLCGEPKRVNASKQVGAE